jgi:DNA replication protein DnaC
VKEKAMLIGSERIADDSLPDEEFDAVVRHHPELAAGPYKYCPTCRKRGSYRYRGVEHACDCREQWQLNMSYLSAGIGLLYQRLDWDDYTGDPEAVSSLQAYVRNHYDYVDQGLGLLFTGARGVGKTMLATLVLKEFMRAGYSCFSATYSSAMEMYTAGWRDRDDKRRFDDRFLHTKVLLLDDMGREAKSSNNMQETTFEHIVRNRVQACRPTILTTNLNYGDLEESYGEAVMSLLTEQSMVVEMTGESFRPKSNARKFDEPESGERRPIF